MDGWMDGWIEKERKKERERERERERSTRNLSPIPLTSSHPQLINDWERKGAKYRLTELDLKILDETRQGIEEVNPLSFSFSPLLSSLNPNPIPQGTQKVRVMNPPLPSGTASRASNAPHSMPRTPRYGTFSSPFPLSSSSPPLSSSSPLLLSSHISFPPYTDHFQAWPLSAVRRRNKHLWYLRPIRGFWRRPSAPFSSWSLPAS